MKRTQRLLVPLVLAALGVLLLPATAFASPGGARAFIQLVMPDKPVYVGQSIPVKISAYYRAGTGVTISGEPELDSPDFTLSGLDTNPAQGHEQFGGQSYLVVSWKGRLSPVKQGHYSLSVKLPSTLTWQSVVEQQLPSAPDNQQGGGMPSPFDSDPFNDPMFGSPFSGQSALQQMQQMMQQMNQQMNQAFGSVSLGPVHKRHVELRSPARPLDVLPLPVKGRPAGFSGAVGNFKIKAQADPTSVHAGEPITLQVRVTGDGNFNRVELGELAASKDFQTYTPTSTTHDGVKTFKQAIVPLHEGITRIPPITFSYFDPHAGAYVTRSTAAIPIRVAQGVALVGSSGGQVTHAASGPTLAPNAVDPGSVARLDPVFSRRWFWLAQALGLLGLGAVLVVITARRRLSRDPSRPLRRQAERALGERRREMDRALSQGDAAAFFLAARGALQQRLGARWGVNPDAITLQEVEARLGDEAEAVRPVFELADAARFTGHGPAGLDLSEWKQRVSHELSHLEGS